MNISLSEWCSIAYLIWCIKYLIVLSWFLRWAHSAQYNVHQAQAAHRKAMDQQDRSSRACGEVVSDNMGMYGELHHSLEACLVGVDRSVISSFVTHPYAHSIQSEQ